MARRSDEFGSLAVSGFVSRLALWQLTRAGDLSCVAAGYCLTRDGKRKAEQLVRSHRLWETYVAKHFELPDDHLHQSANWVEHFIDPMLRGELFAELSEPSKDPHGTVIPHETEVDTAADSRDPS